MPLTVFVFLQLWQRAGFSVPSLVPCYDQTQWEDVSVSIYVGTTRTCSQCEVLAKLNFGGEGNASSSDFPAPGINKYVGSVGSMSINFISSLLDMTESCFESMQPHPT